MNTLTRFWRETTARFRKPFRPHTQSPAVSGMQRANTVVQLDKARDRLAAGGQADSARIASLERRLAGLESEHATTSRQLQEVEQELVVAGSDLENTKAQVKTLAQQLEDGQQLYLQTVQETQMQLRKQDMRLNWLTLVSTFALLLAAVASAILIWDVQKNAGLLAGMSADIKQLMLTVDRQDGRSQTEAQNKQVDGPGTTHMKLPPLPGKASIPSPEMLRPVPDFLPAPGAGPTGEIPTGVDTAPVDPVRQFFERNASIPGMVNLPSGVQYRVVRQGDGKSPGMNDWVVVDYLGMTPDGSIFDNTYDSGQRAVFGMEGLLPGWQEPFLRMQEGSEFEVYVPPDIANIGGIPGNKKQAGDPGIYLIELIQVVQVGDNN